MMVIMFVLVFLFGDGYDTGSYSYVHLCAWVLTKLTRSLGLKAQQQKQGFPRKREPELSRSVHPDDHAEVLLPLS